MNKLEWFKVLEEKVNELKEDTIEQDQDDCLDAFLQAEKENHNLKLNGDVIGDIYYMSYIFDLFQCNYSYENSSNFSKMFIE